MSLTDESHRPVTGGRVDDASAVDEREHVDAESIRLFMDSMPEGLGAGFVAVVILAVWLRQLGVSTGLALWSLSVSAVLGLCFAAYVRYRSAVCTPDQLRRWGRRFVWLAGASALAWGSAAFLFLPGTPAVEMMIILGVTAVSIGGIGHMATHLPCYFGFLFLSGLPFVVSLALIGDTLHAGLSLGLLALLVAAALFARLMNRAVRQSIALAYRNRLLADALAVRTREAEHANLAKSRFLTAASHDLRQPVHAIGLLLDVLRGQGLDRTQGETVERLRRSAESLDDLFDGLLDVSRLDAGEVKPRVGAVSVDGLFATLHAAFEPLARGKGLALRIRASNLAVESDPVLLQRIVANFVANAIRYTPHGGVLVAARRRGGHVGIEVRDTGIGIAADEQAAVFEEFYQCSNPERDRTKGLGLGLAIVRRLAGLLGHAIEMRSTPGRGSMFRVVAPASVVPASVAHETPRPASIVGALAGTRIVVVDDDRAVREASIELLRQWGCLAVPFASMSEVVTAGPTWECAPDLLLSDWRLPDGRDGIALVEWLREEFNLEIPALIATGDTVFARQRGVLPSGVVVLHKPIAAVTLFDTLVALRSRPLEPCEMQGVSPA